MYKEFLTDSSEKTFALGKSMGAQAAPGEIYLLIGDLGAGKTVFAKGFAEGLGVREPVTSPTFNIIKEYRSGRIPFYHFDLYRLTDEDELYAIGADEYWNSDGVCVIEWADIFPDMVWENGTAIDLRKDPERGPECRIITVAGGEKC